MPRYFFHVRSEGDLAEDPEGTDLPDAEAARVEAVESARQMMSDAVRRGFDISGQAFEISDGAGRVVLTLPFHQAIKICRNGVERELACRSSR